MTTFRPGNLSSETGRHQKAISTIEYIRCALAVDIMRITPFVEVCRTNNAKVLEHT